MPNRCNDPAVGRARRSHRVRPDHSRWQTKDVQPSSSRRTRRPTQRATHETNAGVYVFDGQLLRTALSQLTTDNVQGEEYLTDVLASATNDGHRIVAVATDDPHEVLGVNDRAQLAELGRILRDRLVGTAMRLGVTVVDPSTTWLDVDVTLERDVMLRPNVQLRGRTHVNEGAVVGPDSTLTDSTVGPDAHVERTVAVRAIDRGWRPRGAVHVPTSGNPAGA